MVRPVGSFENAGMSTESDRQLSVATAMSEVLGAERDALAQIAACEQRADEILRDARKAVRAIVRRTQKRISRLHAGCTERTRDLVAKMELELTVDAERSVPGDGERDMLRKAVSAVARELTERDASDVD